MNNRRGKEMKKIMLIISFFIFYVFTSISFGEEEYPRLIELPQNIAECGIDHGVSWKAYPLNKNDSPVNLFGNLAEDAKRFNRLDGRFWREGTIIRMPEDVALIKNWTPMPKNFGKCARFEKCIVVSLADQFLGIYSKGILATSYPVSTGMNKMLCGKPEGSRNCKTPIGDFVVRGRSLKLYSYPYRVWMWYTLDIGYGRYIHVGNLSGFAASHGCIRLFKRDAFMLFKMIRASAKVSIIGKV